MYRNILSDELPIDLLTHDLDSRSFLMFLRRENERNREICTFQQSSPNARGFARMDRNENSSTKTVIPSYMLSVDGITITDDISRQLLDDQLSIVDRQWKQSKKKFSTKIQHIQSNLNAQANFSMTKTMRNCQVVLFNWIAKSRLKKDGNQ
ncbi:hypothetical protein I4U23_002033 [Adineta vaga]|nr:hypothetical protein I4U23_002033 [Adineta vaga]